MVVGGVVGEYGGAVEGAVGLGEVEPAFVADAFGTLAADAYADDVCRGVEEFFAEGDERFVANFLDEGVDSHGVDEFIIVDAFTVFEAHDLGVCVNALDRAMGAKLGLLFGNGICYSNPYGTCTAVSWEAEGGVGTPVAGGLLQYDILCDILEIRSRYTFAEPLALHLRSFSFVTVVRSTGNPPSSLAQPRP